MIKKLITITTLVVYSLSLFTSVLAADGESEAEAVQTSSYENAVYTLRELGFIDNEFSAHTPITRATLIQTVVGALGLKDLSLEGLGGKVFLDVPIGYWAESSIAFAANLGIINGSGDGYFNPEGTVSYEAAMKIIVNTLGYDMQSMARGGYPSGYMLTATTLGLTQGIVLDDHENISGGVVAQMLYNALEVGMQRSISFGEDIGFHISDNYTLLTLNEMVTIEGLVNQTGKTSLVGESSIGEDKVIIGNQIFNLGDTDATAHLGYKVKAYAVEQDNSYTLLYVNAERYPNKVLTIAADDISNVTDNANSKTIEYMSDDRKYTITLIGADYIYNGLAHPGCMAVDLRPDVGYLTLVDNNNDGKYDVVFIKDYITYVIGSVSTGRFMIADKLTGATIELDPYINWIDITKNGTPTTLEEIKQWDVASIAVSKPATKPCIEVTVTSNRLIGTIEEIGYEDGKRTVTMNQKIYEVSPAFQDALEPGASGTYLIDIFDRLLWTLEEGEADWLYGLVIGKDYGTGMSNLKIKILGSDGLIEVYETTNSVTIDGVRTPQATIKNGSTNLSIRAKHLVAYKLNAQNQLTAVETQFGTHENAKVRLSGGITYTDTDGVLTPNKRKYNKNVPVLFYPYSAEDTLSLKTTAIVFVGPKLTDPDAVYEDADYMVQSTEYFVHDDEYVTEVFNADDFLQSGLVVVSHEDSTAFPNASRLVMVEKIVTAKNSNDQDVYKIIGWNRGNKVESVCASTMVDRPSGAAGANYVLPQDLKPGDIIRYLSNFNNEVNYIEYMHQAKNTEEYSASTDTYEGEPMTSYGEIIDLKGTNILMATLKDPFTGQVSRLRHFNIYTLPVGILSTAGDRTVLRTGRAADVYVGMKILLRSSDGYVSDVFAYE